jgi:hypothetical protein
MLEGAGIPKDAPAISAIQALMGEGLSLGAETIKAVRSVVLRHAAKPGKAAVLAARALAVGLQFDDDGLDALIHSISDLTTENVGKETGRTSGRQSAKDAGCDPSKDNDRESGEDSGKNAGKGSDDHAYPGSGGHDSGQHRQSGQRGQQDPQDQALVKYECQDEKELQKALESIFIHISSRAAADPGFAALARKGPNGYGWLCVPYRFSLDGVDFSGYFRIVFNYASRKVERLVAEIDSSGLTRVCDMSWGSTGEPKLRFMPGSSPEGDEFTRLFGASMRVEVLRPEDVPGLVDTPYGEVNGHA